MAKVDSDITERAKLAVAELESEGFIATPLRVTRPDGYVVDLIATRAERQAKIEKTGRLFKTLDEVLSNKTSVRWLVDGWLERGVIALLIGPRGSLKSFLMLDRLMRVALDGEPVAIVSAEGRGIDRRINAWLQTFAPDTDRGALQVYVIERRLNLNEGDDLATIRAELEFIKPAAVGLDTFSKLSGPGLDENDNSKVRAFIGRLDTELKTPLDCAVLMVAHTGHSAKERARGASALEADTDCALVVRKNSDESITVTRERFKDSPSLDPVRLEREVIDLGYVDSDGTPVTSLVLHESDKPARGNRAEPQGTNKRAVMAAAREHARLNPIDAERLIDLIIESEVSDGKTSSRTQRKKNLRRSLNDLIHDGYLFKHGDNDVALTRVSEAMETWLDE